MPLPSWTDIESSENFKNLEPGKKVQVVSKYADDLLKESSNKQGFSEDSAKSIEQFKSQKLEEFSPISTEDKILGGARSIGAVVPFSDEIEAGLNTIGQKGAELVTGKELPETQGMGFADLYRKRLADSNQEQKRFTTQHPVASTALTLGAGLATLPLAEVSGAFNASKGVMALENIARGAATGAVYGAGNNEDRLGEAITGAALGAAAPVALKGIGKVLEPVANAGKTLVQAIGRGIGVLPAQEAEDIFIKHVGEKGLEQLKNLGAESSPIDLRKAQILARRVASASEDAGDEIASFLTQRADEEASKVEGLMNTFLTTKTKSQAIEDIADEYKPIAQAQYAKAYSKPIRIDPRMSQLLDLFTRKGWLNKASEIAELDEVPFKLLTSKPGYFMKTMDADIIKQSMDDAYAATKETQPAIARRILAKKKEWVELIDNKNKEYPKARKAGGDPIILEQTIEEGRNISKLRPEEIKQYAVGSKETSDAQKDAFIIGVKDYLRQGIANIKEGGKSTGGFKKGIRDNLKVLLGDNDSKIFLESIDELENQRETLNKVLGGSPTTPRAEEGSKVIETAKKVFRNPIGGTFEVLVDPLMSRVEGLTKENAVPLAKLLTSKSFSAKQLQDFAQRNKLDFTQLNEAIEEIAKRSSPIASQNK